MLPCCLCCKRCCCSPFVLFQCCVDSLLVHCLSIIHWCLCCFVLFCSAPSSLLCLLLACLYPGACVFSAVPVPPPPGVNIEEHIQIRQEEKRQRINRRHRLEEGRGMDLGDGGYIYGLNRFCFMNLKDINDTDWGKVTKQDSQSRSLLETSQYSVSIPFFSSAYHFQVLTKPWCCALVIAPLLVS